MARKMIHDVPAGAFFMKFGFPTTISMAGSIAHG